MLKERANKKTHINWIDNELSKIAKRDAGPEPQIVYDYNGSCFELVVVGFTV